MAKKFISLPQKVMALPMQGKRISRKLALLIALIFLAVFSVAVAYRFLRGNMLSEAVVEGIRANLVSPVSGLIVERNAQEGKFVKTGEVLFVIDQNISGNEKIDPDRLRLLEDQLHTAERAEEDARIFLRQVANEHSKALLALRNPTRQKDSGEEAKKDRLRVQEAEKKARANLEQARTHLETASSARYIASLAYRQARADIGLGKRQTQKSEPPQVISAPIDGTLTELISQTGPYVIAGQNLGVIEPLFADHLWVRAKASPAQAAKFTDGQKFLLRFAGSDGLELEGYLEAMPDILPPDILPKDRQDISINIRLVNYNPLIMPQLRIGQSVEAVIR